MNIQFGKVKSIAGARVVVSITGAGGACSVEALLVQPCGVSGPAVWLAPSVGDVVAVAFNAERPEDSVVLGVVYPDGKTPPKTGADEIAIQAGKVFIGDDVNATKPCPRDDHVQDELSKIKSELDAIKSAFSAHTHTVPALTVAGAVPAGTAPVVAGPGSTGPAPVYAQGYTVGATASDSVEVK